MYIVYLNQAHQTKILINAHTSHLISKTVFGVLQPYLRFQLAYSSRQRNKSLSDCANVQAVCLSFPLVVRIWHKLVFWREIKTPAHPRHCRDSSKIKSLHLGPAMAPESPATREPGIQMTGALKKRLLHFQILGK